MGTSMLKKILIVFIVIILLGTFLLPKKVHAAEFWSKVGQKLLNALYDLIRFVADLLLGIMQKIMLGKSIDVSEGIYYSPGIIFSNKVPGLRVNFITATENDNSDSETTYTIDEIEDKLQDKNSDITSEYYGTLFFKLMSQGHETSWKFPQYIELSETAWENIKDLYNGEWPEDNDTAYWANYLLQSIGAGYLTFYRFQPNDECSDNPYDKVGSEDTTDSGKTYFYGNAQGWCEEHFLMETSNSDLYKNSLYLLSVTENLYAYDKVGHNLSFSYDFKEGSDNEVEDIWGGEKTQYMPQFVNGQRK